MTIRGMTIPKTIRKTCEKQVWKQGEPAVRWVLLCGCLGSAALKKGISEQVLRYLNDKDSEDLQNQNLKL